MLLPLNRALARRKSSLHRNFFKSGCISPAGIIPAEQFCRNRMHFCGGNHPCRAILSNQDAIPRRESSLHRNFFKSGCITPVGIIPAEQFCQIRMHFCGGNHPCRAILSNQDAFSRWKSSLHRNFFRSGCIFAAEIIPGEQFCQIRMHFSGRKSSQTSYSARKWCQPYQ